ncbi:MAG: rod shape-determining protein MreD [Pleurocapsa sp. SU_5_0]|nr:rod shape-determining protein MreD [Pleurocapsa sp. SU_5_0]NJO95883.1 rod shape-determining protein MreD [Pleurocapsa sp. CRU_1_2]NJR44948.1 rod shape-determining protein MreD [Hyellaceae cyanobacterium CSU_1_1]
MQRHKQRSFDILKVINLLFITISIAVCIVLMLVNIPGMELLEVNPNWLLIWIVAWSINKTAWSGAIAGLMIGCIYDGITLSAPSHILSFVVVGVLTSSLKTQKYLGEDFISVAFVVFFMTFLSEAIFALQYGQEHSINLTDLLQKYQQVVVISAIITSLWSPAFYYPLNLWQKKLGLWRKKLS